MFFTWEIMQYEKQFEHTRKSINPNLYKHNYQGWFSY